MNNYQYIANFNWNLAVLLSGDYKPAEYGKVVLPFTSFSTEKRGYTVPTIPDKEFTDYQILARYYVCCAISAPLQLTELGLPYEKEFELAKKMRG